MKLIPLITREEAYAAALRFFFTGKPCRRGHIAQRYTSAGTCVDCLADSKKSQATKNSVAKRLRNAKMAKDKEAYVLSVPRRWQPVLDLLQDIMFKNNDDQLESLGAIIEDMHQKTCKKMPVPAPPLRNVLTLFREDLLRMVDFRDNAIQNWQALHYAPEDDRGPVRLMLDHNWYAGLDVMACLRGEVTHIYPCKLLPA